MSSDEDEVKLYSALERNKKRHMMVSLSSSSDDENDGENHEEYSIQETQMKRRKNSFLPTESENNLAAGRKTLDDSDDDENDLYTPMEREAERLRKERLEKEIRQKLEKDKLLNQTRSILKKVSTTKRQAVNNTEVISLDSDSSDEHSESVAHPSQPIMDKGPRITLHVRSNGGSIDDICIYKEETFDQLCTRFCDLHGLPRSAVKMSLDGEVLQLSKTPASEDLDTGDIIEAKVDFTQQNEAKKKKYLRLRLIKSGKRSEVFKIDSTSTVAKLHGSYCQRHDIVNPDNVILSIHDQELRLNETLKYYGLIDNDEILVSFKNLAASMPQPQPIQLQLRFANGDLETHYINLTSKIQNLLAKIANKHKCRVSSLLLLIDGEKMSASQTFKDYGIEGGEIIEVKMVS
ncbi:putative Ubiquitin domain-containing protein [Plasmopara halstedii]